MHICEKITGTGRALSNKLSEVAAALKAVGLPSAAESVRSRAERINDRANGLTVREYWSALSNVRADIFAILGEEAAVLTRIAPRWISLCASKQAEYAQSRAEMSHQFATIKQRAEETFYLSLELTAAIEQAKNS